MAFISFLPNRAGMKREPRNFFSARSRHSREGADGHYVDAGRVEGTVIYRNAPGAEYDRRKSYHAYSDIAGGWLYFGNQILSKPPAAHDLFIDGGGAEGLYNLHQFAGNHHPAEQTEVI